MFPCPLSLPEVSELLRDGFNETVARELYSRGEAVVVWVMLQLAVLAQQRAAQSCEVSPSTPSGAIPVYQKEPSKKRCRRDARNDYWTSNGCFYGIFTLFYWCFHSQDHQHFHCFVLFQVDLQRTN
jgi:hypothetical protein